MIERLSDKNPCDSCKVDRQIGNPNRWECECDRCLKPSEWKDECIKNLAEYETADEEKRLIVLPSAQVYLSMGGTIYYIYDYEIYECINCGITIDADGKVFIELRSYDDILRDEVPASEWGKTVFISREESEKTLSDMEKQ